MMPRYMPKYKDTISDMNAEYTNLLHAYKYKDCRVEYLQSFEQALALNCNDPIWQNERYFRITAKYPLPEEGYISRQQYRLYMMLYYYLMRDAGLLNREAEMSDGEWGVQSHAFGGEERLSKIYFLNRM